MSPATRTTGLDGRIDEYWDWITVALFLLITVDLLTTLYAAHAVGPTAESNPLTRWLLGQGGLALAVVNIVAAALVVVLFDALMGLLRGTPTRWQAGFALAIELWLGLLVAAGLVVFANNLLVIVAGISLL